MSEWLWLRKKHKLQFKSKLKSKLFSKSKWEQNQQSENKQKNIAMKKDIHPKNYRLVVFKDMSNDHAFMSRSTINTKDTIVWEDGNEYPLVKLEISNTSHPFYTGKMKLVDTAGRVDKFNSKYKKFQEARNANK